MPDLSADLDLRLVTLQQDLRTVSANDAIAISETWGEHLLSR